MHFTSARNTSSHQIPSSLVNSLDPCRDRVFQTPSGTTLTLNFELEHDWLYNGDGANEINDLIDCLHVLDRGQASDLTPTIATISIRGNRCPTPEPLFHQLLSNITTLRDVHWHSSCLPRKRTLDSIERHHPTARFHYIYSDEHWRNLPGALKNRRCLYSIRAEITYGGVEEPFHLPALERLIVNAPYLKSLEIAIRHNGGCLLANDQPYAFGFFNLRKGHTFPRISNLKLEGYNFDAIADGDHLQEQLCSGDQEENSHQQIWRTWLRLKFWIKSILKKDYHPLYHNGDRHDYKFLSQKTCQTPAHQRIPNIDKWVRFMDWSDVQSFTLVTQKSLSSHVSDVLARQFSTLHYLKLHGASISVVIELLQNLSQPLKSLTLIDSAGAGANAVGERLTAAIPPGLQEVLADKHADTIESLTVWSHHMILTALSGRACSTRNVSKNVGNDDFETLFTSLAKLPHLRLLDMGVNRVLDEDIVLSRSYETLLASLSNLEQLTLRYPSFRVAQSVHNDRQLGISNPGTSTNSYLPMSRLTSKPQFSIDVVNDLFNALRIAQRVQTSARTVGDSLSSHSHARLMSLDIYMGDWDMRDNFHFPGEEPIAREVGHWRCRFEPTNASERSLGSETCASSRESGNPTIENSLAGEILCEEDVMWPKFVARYETFSRTLT